MLAKSSFCSSINSDSRTKSLPRSVAGSFFHVGALKAARAARTALSTSSALAASTVAISFSVLDTIKRLPSDNTRWNCMNSRWVQSGNCLPTRSIHEFVVDEESRWLLVGVTIIGVTIRCGQVDRKPGHGEALCSCIGRSQITWTIFKGGNSCRIYVFSVPSLGMAFCLLKCIPPQLGPLFATVGTRSSSEWQTELPGSQRRDDKVQIDERCIPR